MLAFAYTQSSEEEVEVVDRYGSKVKRYVHVNHTIRTKIDATKTPDFTVLPLNIRPT